MKDRTLVRNIIIIFYFRINNALLQDQEQAILLVL